jgi:4-nitrophenyl phosphatase
VEGEQENLVALRSIKNFIIDMDGVLYRGQQPLAGAQEFLSHLRRRGVPFILATNNSIRTPQQYVAKLRAMDIEVAEDHILTSAQATAMYLSRVAPPRAKVYLIGEEGLSSAVREQGFIVTDREVDFVVMGLDFDLTYEKLKIATLAIRAGASFIATNPDTTLPTEQGLIPGSGAILAALEAATGISPLVIGKPQAILLRLAMEKLGITPDGTAIIGDRLETDILGGKEVGLTTVLVLTGVSDREELETSPFQPDLVFDSIGRLYEAWARYQEDWKLS